MKELATGILRHDLSQPERAPGTAWEDNPGVTGFDDRAGRLAPLRRPPQARTGHALAPSRSMRGCEAIIVPQSPARPVLRLVGRLNGVTCLPGDLYLVQAGDSRLVLAARPACRPGTDALAGQYPFGHGDLLCLGGLVG
jgi:hypothetical protein